MFAGRAGKLLKNKSLLLTSVTMQHPFRCLLKRPDQDF
jgi:hypothetical protein